MLSRVADSLYWINRYLERAENISRFVEVSEAMALDCPPGSAEPWLPLVDATGDRRSFDRSYPAGTPKDVIRFLLLDRDNPNSIISCIAAARENARQIRDVITSEMWEQMNDLHWSLQEGEAIWLEPVQEQLRSIRRGCQIIYGITDSTLSRDLSWLFSQLGRLIERADKTSRILDVKYYLLLPSISQVGSTLDVKQWETILRSVSALRSYQWLHGATVNPRDIAQFMILHDQMPRSLAFCYNKICDNLGYLAKDYGEKTEACEMADRIHLDYLRRSMDAIFDDGLHEFIGGFLGANGRLGMQIAKDYSFEVTA